MNITQAQHADNFVGRYNGKYIDEDKYFGSQCWDVVARYAREEYGCAPFPTVSGGAEGLWRFYGSPRSQPISQFFDQVPASELRKGDIAVWGADFYPPYGHTSLVWAREGNTIWSFEQDGSKDPNGDGIADGVSYLVQRAITSKLSGGLRPKGAETMASDDFIRSVYIEAYGEPAKEEDLRVWRGHPAEEVWFAVYGAPRRDVYIKWRVRKFFRGWLQRDAKENEVALYAPLPEKDQINGISDSDEAKAVTKQYNEGTGGTPKVTINGDEYVPKG